MGPRWGSAVGMHAGLTNSMHKLRSSMVSESELQLVTIYASHGDDL